MQKSGNRFFAKNHALTKNYSKMPILDSGGLL
jgi:hypothetical protein